MFSAVLRCSQLFSDVLSCFPMFSDVFRCSQLFSDLLGCFSTFLAVFGCSQLFPDVLSCFPMFSAVFRCSQLFCDIFSWVITFMDNHTSVRCITNPCTRILLSSLYEVGNLWQDQDASVGNQIGPNSTT